MSRKGSVATLLVVAVVALGLMAFIGFNDGTTGAVQVGGGAPSISYPTHTDSYYYTQQGGATASDVGRMNMVSEDTLHLLLLIHCKGATDPEIIKLCQKYFVPTS